MATTSTPTALAATTVLETITHNITWTVTASSASATSTSRATPQGGIFDGVNPSHYDPKNPIIMFIIQAGIVIIFCRLLHWPLSRIRQPRVIAEVIGGILLGPSVMGRIPGFTNAIFPAASIPTFSMVANLGLVLFLFLVGLEVDVRFLLGNWKVALSVGLGGMALPFGLGCAISWGLYQEYHNEDDTVAIAFGTYMLFIAIAMAITAFPVLCRILTELKLLSTPVGVIVLSAGVGNDVVGWILLALCVALVNAGDGTTALYVLLTATAFTLFMILIVRRGFLYFLRKTRSLDDGPNQSVVALTLLIVLASAFFTGIIGIHPIFGAFLAGLICPHEGGFAIKLTEKIEDLVGALLLPLYFALSGLSTNLGLLNNGTAWAYVVAVTVVAFVAKVAGGSGAARLNGLVWRECFTIGALMSCKGLVELIVLNIGLQAKILSQRTFTIFVVMALVTTFATTPLVAALYPPWYQKKIEAWKRGEIDWDTGRPLDDKGTDSPLDSFAVDKREIARVHRVLVYLRLDSMPSLLALTALFGGSNSQSETSTSTSTTTSSSTSKTQTTIKTTPLSSPPTNTPISIHGLRLVQLTDRESSVMKVSEADEYSTSDPIVNTFRAFGRLHSVDVSGEVAVVPESYYADTLATRADEMNADLLLLPWSETGVMSEWHTLSPKAVRNRFSGGAYNDFVGNVLKHATTTAVGVFVNKGFGVNTGTGLDEFRFNTYASRSWHLSRSLSGAAALTPAQRAELLAATKGAATATNTAINTHANPGDTDRTHRVFVPYFGSIDDRAAVRFVLQLAADPRLTVTIVHFPRADVGISRSSSVAFAAHAVGEEEVDVLQNLDLPLSSSTNDIATRVARRIMKRTMSSSGNGAEDIPLDDRHAAFLRAMRSSLPSSVAERVSIETAVLGDGAESIGIRTARAVTECAVKYVGGVLRANAGDLVVLGRNVSTPDGSCFGVVGDALAEGLGASLLVVRAAQQ